ncbi:MAG: metalloregulator ArsR/SmtB family transcription factor [Alicyclobacillus sp.]|nr:metalloregulator ArsR/SmtB family transcription factor [Alicyclobacillus sp.]
MFKALADPKRFQIVDLLRNGPLSVGEIADRLGLAQPQTSKHLRVLTKAGLVAIYPEANRRIYKLRPGAFQELGDWLRSYQTAWEDRLERLELHLRGLVSDETEGS